MSVSNQKWLQIYAKAIELQILHSKQGEQMLENQVKILALLEKIEAHFTNGFRSEIKAFMREEIKAVTTPVKSIEEKVEDIQGSIWKQWWLWGGITLFTLVNAIITIVSLWANGFILSSGGK